MRMARLTRPGPVRRTVMGVGDKTIAAMERADLVALAWKAPGRGNAFYILLPAGRAVAARAMSMITGKPPSEATFQR